MRGQKISFSPLLRDCFSLGEEKPSERGNKKLGNRRKTKEKHPLRITHTQLKVYNYTIHFSAHLEYRVIISTLT